MAEDSDITSSEETSITTVWRHTQSSHASNIHTHGSWVFSVFKVIMHETIKANMSNVKKEKRNSDLWPDAES